MNWQSFRHWRAIFCVAHIGQWNITFEPNIISWGFSFRTYQVSSVNIYLLLQSPQHINIKLQSGRSSVESRSRTDHYQSRPFVRMDKQNKFNCYQTIWGPTSSSSTSEKPDSSQSHTRQFGLDFPFYVIMTNYWLRKRVNLNPIQW